MIDTHTHLYDRAFAAGCTDPMAGCCDAVDRAVAAGVNMMVLPNVDRESIGPLKALRALRPEVTAAAMGLHPTELGTDWRATLDIIEAELRRGGYCAIGEVGIDLYWDRTYEREQMLAFDAQLALAEEMSLPVIIHCREGLDRTLEVLQGHRGVSAVFHSFGGSADDVAAIRAEGDFYFGINGIVTFKNSGLREILPEIGSGRILLETDSPYLAPVPKRGRRNESAYLPYIAQTVADALEMSVEKLAEITTANAAEFFRLPASV